MLTVVLLACILLAAAIAAGSASKLLTKVLFLTLSVCLIVWTPAVQWFMSTDNFAQQVVAAKLFYIVSGLFAPTLFLFAVYYPRGNDNLFKKVLPFVVTPSIFMLLWILLADKFIVDQISTVDGKQFVEVNTGQYLAFSAFFVTFFLLAVIVNVYKYFTYKGEQKYQTIWYTAGIVITSIPGFYANLILPYLGNYELIWLGPVAVIVFLAMTFYSIIRHSLFDIRLAVVRSLAYIMSLLVMASLYIGLAYAISVTLFRNNITTGFSLSPVNVALAVLLAFIFQPIRQFFDRVTDQIFYRDTYDTDKFITELGAVLTSTTDLRKMLTDAGHKLARTLKASDVMFVVYRNDRQDVLVSTDHAIHINTKDLELVRELLETDAPTVLLVNQAISSSRDSGHRTTRALRILAKAHIELVLSLEGVGYVLLGDQKSNGYTNRDVHVLETISDELIIAIQNARSVQEVQDVNTHLEQRINKATAELRRSNEKLKRIDATKDEFVSMASHQLRTPLTSIKGYISMVLDGDAGEITDQQRKLLKEAFASSERMVRLISDFLNVSRLQTGKFNIERKQVNLADIVQDEVDSIESMASTRDIALTYKKPKHFPSMQLDEDKIRQVIMNFIDNAIYYSRAESTIVVKLIADDKHAVLEVHDHGIGVPKEALDKLFTKFFRADNARRQRPDGTGVGLYLAKRVVSEHGGELIVESTEGKGSVFGFRLPVK